MDLKEKLDEISSNSFDIFLEEFKTCLDKQQRNYCVKILRKTKMQYFQNMPVNKANDNKMFWKTVKPRFSNKFKAGNTIILTQGDMIMRNEKLIADTFNNYFADITKTLKLKKHPNFDGQSLFIITDYFKS